MPMVTSGTFGAKGTQNVHVRQGSAAERRKAAKCKGSPGRDLELLLFLGTSLSVLGSIIRFWLSSCLLHPLTRGLKVLQMLLKSDV